MRPPAPPAAHATTTPLPWGKSPLRGASPGSDQWAPPPTHPAAADREKHHHGAGKAAPPRTSPVSVLMIPALELSVDLESSRDEDDGVDATMEWHRSSSNAEADALAADSLATTRGPSATAMDFDGATFVRRRHARAPPPPRDDDGDERDPLEGRRARPTALGASEIREAAEARTQPRPASVRGLRRRRGGGE